MLIYTQHVTVNYCKTLYIREDLIFEKFAIAQRRENKVLANNF